MAKTFFSLTEHLLQALCGVDVHGERYAWVSEAVPIRILGKPLVTQGPLRIILTIAGYLYSQQGVKSQTSGGRSQSIPSCSSYGTIVTKDTKALQCDRCLSAGARKCADCLNLSAKMYDYVVADSSAALRWFCEDCDKVVMNMSGDPAAACQKSETGSFAGCY